MAHGHYEGMRLTSNGLEVWMRRKDGTDIFRKLIPYSKGEEVRIVYGKTPKRKLS